MIRRALLLITLAAIYIAVKRGQRNTEPLADPTAEAQWANEGGANAPASV